MLQECCRLVWDCCWVQAAAHGLCAIGSLRVGLLIMRAQGRQLRLGSPRAEGHIAPSNECGVRCGFVAAPAQTPHGRGQEVEQFSMLSQAQSAQGASARVTQVQLMSLGAAQCCAPVLGAVLCMRLVQDWPSCFTGLRPATGCGNTCNHAHARKLLRTCKPGTTR